MSQNKKPTLKFNNKPKKLKLENNYNLYKNLLSTGIKQTTQCNAINGYNITFKEVCNKNEEQKFLNTNETHNSYSNTNTRPSISLIKQTLNNIIFDTEQASQIFSEINLRDSLNKVTEFKRTIIKNKQAEPIYLKTSSDIKLNKKLDFKKQLSYRKSIENQIEHIKAKVKFY
jgi:hypothetical protein